MSLCLLQHTNVCTILIPHTSSSTSPSLAAPLLRALPLPRQPPLLLLRVPAASSSAAPAASHAAMVRCAGRLLLHRACRLSCCYGPLRRPPSLRAAPPHGREEDDERAGTPAPRIRRRLPLLLLRAWPLPLLRARPHLLFAASPLLPWLGHPQRHPAPPHLLHYCSTHRHCSAAPATSPPRGSALGSAERGPGGGHTAADPSPTTSPPASNSPRWPPLHAGVHSSSPWPRSPPPLPAAAPSLDLLPPRAATSPISIFPFLSDSFLPSPSTGSPLPLPQGLPSVAMCSVAARSGPPFLLQRRFLLLCSDGLRFQDLEAGYGYI